MKFDITWSLNGKVIVGNLVFRCEEIIIAEVNDFVREEKIITTEEQEQVKEKRLSIKYQKPNRPNLLSIKLTTKSSLISDSC